MKMPDASVLESVAEEDGEGMDIAKSQITPRVSESSEFTFHPRVSSASSRIVNNLGMGFFERQQKHMEKQKKLLDQIPQGSDQPGSKRAKFASVQKENSEILKKRPTTSEPVTSAARRPRKTRESSFYDPDSPRIPMPPTSPQPNFLTRSKTYFAMTSSKSRKRAVNDPYANMDRLQKAKVKAEKAIKTKKIFSIHGPYPLIRRALRERGWVEKEFKLPPRKSKEKGDSSDVDDADDFDDDDDDQKDSGVGTSPRPDSDNDDDPDNKYGIMGRMVRNEVPTFQWTTRNVSIDWRFLQKDQIVNHYAKANFTTKVGLCMNLRSLTCFADSDVNSFFPRCYRLSQEEDKLDFIDDFRLGAATAILRIAIDRHTGEETDGRDPEKTGQKPPGVSTHIVPQSVLQLAIRVCELYAQEREHDDIDLSGLVCTIPEDGWNLLIQNYYKLAHDGALIEDSESLLKKSEAALEKMKSLNLQYQIDGLMNTWIVKPGAKSRGRGIIVMNKLEEILKLVQCDPTLMKDGRWVVQKYIERPLLVYGTKFDIRQWFLVTDWNPMMIWMYKSSYLRFSTKPFSLTNLDPSVHLCNYSVQKNFEIDSQRHPMLPEENMWSNDDFRRYLQSRGCESLWENLIYPGMKKAIIHMCQTAQDVVDYRKGSFELYGADFMIDESYNPWLIEVNSSPTMSRSTVVTSKLCASVQEDTIKVVLDRRRDKHCDVGQFELAFKQPILDVPLYVGKSLQVEGFAIKRPGGSNLRRTWINNTANNSFQPVPPRTQPTAGQESRLVRALSQPRQQQGRIIARPQVSRSSPMRASPERSVSPVKLRMQNTMNRLSHEVKSTPMKQSALNLPRFSSNSNLNANNVQQPVSKALSQGNLTKTVNSNRGTNPTVGGFHCVSTTHAKVASSMGIMHQTSGLVGAANRGSVRQHHVIIPKTFPPSLVPGCNVTPHKGLPASGIVAVSPHNFGLTLPFQRLLGGDVALAGNSKSRQMEIYNYPGQDFRLNGPGRQRVSGIYDWMEDRRRRNDLNIFGVPFDSTNCDVDNTHHSNDCDDDNSSHCDNTNTDDLISSACNCDHNADSQKKSGHDILPPLEIDRESREAGENNSASLKEGRLFPQFPDLCSGDFVLYPFHANEGVKHPLFSKKTKENLSKVEIYSSDDLTNSVITEKSINFEKMAKYYSQPVKSLKSRRQNPKYSKNPTLPQPPPVLKLFSLKQRHEKNLGVAHESFLTVSCPSVSSNQSWLSSQR